jgi:hypothetical protein
MDALNEQISVEEGNALDLLQSIYRDPCIPLPVRMRAATIAIAYESPRLAVTAYLSNADDFAARLDTAIEKSRSPKIIEHRPEGWTAPRFDRTGSVAR